MGKQVDTTGGGDSELGDPEHRIPDGEAGVDLSQDRIHQQADADDDAVAVTLEQEVPEAHDPQRHDDGREVQTAHPALPGDRRGDETPTPEEAPVHLAAVGHLPAGPQGYEQHGDRQGRI